METSNKAGEVEQPKSNQTNQRKETTDPYMNKTPVVGKARARTPVSSEAKSLSRSSSPSSSARRSTSSRSAAQKNNTTRAKQSGNSNASVSKDTPEADSTKIMVSEVSNEVLPIDRELKKETEPSGPNTTSGGERADYIKSVAGNRKEEEQTADLQFGEENNMDNLQKDTEPRKGLKKLRKKSIKAEKKVDKVMMKYKKALKDEVKRSKLKTIHQKLIKAFSKLRKRHRKLREAEAKDN